jgi:thymidylate synthase (FAD)
MNVLDKGFVRLVDQMGSDLSVVNAARISFGRESESMNDKDLKLLRYLWDHQHTSPFRHATLQFHIKAPLFVLRQWMKHQVGCAWNEISGRYVKFNPEFYVPSTWRKQHQSNKQGSQGEITDSKSAQILYESNMNCAVEDYYELLSMGVCKEQARMVLPLSLYSECYWTTSLQAVLHFLKLREDEHSQKEIREYAQAVRVITQEHFPESLKLEQRS